MTVYVDDMRLQATVGKLAARWSHLTVGPGDDLAELHAFAVRIGLKRSWFQGPPEHRHPHYDVTDTKRRQAIAAGATAITWREAGEMLAAARRRTAEALAPPDDPEVKHPCPGSCGRTDTRLYACGWRCPEHTPARLAGQPEPDTARYCAPYRCYCHRETCGSVVGPLDPIRLTVVDTNAIASGKRRARSLAEYREAQAQVHGRPA